nr:integrase, catalytic region, zinc finger, CCHC-type, peptidase aspartic, catalytic [Tanacetum cinerariifolium]
MSRHVLTVGSIMRIPLLCRGEYSQWVERFMNYLKEQTNEEAMINSIKNGLPNDIYSLIDSNNTAKDLWDALARHMLGSEYVINDLKKCGYSKDNGELNFKFLNNLQAEWKQYATLMRQNKNLMDINSDALYNILKQNQGDVNDAMGLKKKTVVVTSDPLALIAEKTKVNKSKEKVVVSSDFEGSAISSSSADEKISEKRIKKANQQSKDFKNQKKDLKDKYDVLKNQATTFEMNNKELNEQLKVLIEKNDDLLAQMKTVHMIMPSKDILYNGRKGIGFKNPIYFEKAKDLRPSLYDEKAIGLGYTLMFLTHSDETLEIEKFKRARENKIKFSYDYGSLNASYVNEKIKFLDDYFQEIINPDFEKIDSLFQQTSPLKPYVPNVILEKIIIDLEDEVVSLLEKEKANLETIESLKSKDFESSENAISESENQSENDSHVVKKEYDKEENSKVIAPGLLKLSVSQSVSPISIPKNSGVIWKKKRLSNTSNVDLSSIVQICLWIIDSGCSKHMTGNRVLLTNFMEKFLGTVL